MNEVDRLFERFDSLIEQFEQLLLCIGDKKYFPRPQLIEVQEQFRAIKERLGEVSKELQRREKTDLERFFLFPAVEKARTRLHAKWNSNPISSNWFHQLCDAQGDLKHMGSDLHRFRQKVMSR